MSNKEIVQDLLRRLPESASLHDIAREIEFAAGGREMLATSRLALECEKLCAVEEQTLAEGLSAEAWLDKARGAALRGATTAGLLAMMRDET